MRPDLTNNRSNEDDLQGERQEAERMIGQLQEQISQLQQEAKNAAAESLVALDEASRKAQQDLQALQVCAGTSSVS